MLIDLPCPSSVSNSPSISNLNRINNQSLPCQVDAPISASTLDISLTPSISKVNKNQRTSKSMSKRISKPKESKSSKSILSYFKKFTKSKEEEVEDLIEIVLDGNNSQEKLSFKETESISWNHSSRRSTNYDIIAVGSSSNVPDIHSPHDISLEGFSNVASSDSSSLAKRSLTMACNAFPNELKAPSVVPYLNVHPKDYRPDDSKPCCSTVPRVSDNAGSIPKYFVQNGLSNGSAEAKNSPEHVTTKVDSRVLKKPLEQISNFKTVSILCGTNVTFPPEDITPDMEISKGMSHNMINENEDKNKIGKPRDRGDEKYFIIPVSDPIHDETNLFSVATNNDQQQIILNDINLNLSSFKNASLNISRFDQFSTQDEDKMLSGTSLSTPPIYPFCPDGFNHPCIDHSTCAPEFCPSQKISENLKLQLSLQYSLGEFKIEPNLNHESSLRHQPDNIIVRMETTTTQSSGVPPFFKKSDQKSLIKQHISLPEKRENDQSSNMEKSTTPSSVNHLSKSRLNQNYTLPEMDHNCQLKSITSSIKIRENEVSNVGSKVSNCIYELGDGGNQDSSKTVDPSMNPSEMQSSVSSSQLTKSKSKYGNSLPLFTTEEGTSETMVPNLDIRRIKTLGNHISSKPHCSKSKMKFKWALPAVNKDLTAESTSAMDLLPNFLHSKSKSKLKNSFSLPKVTSNIEMVVDKGCKSENRISNMSQASQHLSAPRNSSKPMLNPINSLPESEKEFESGEGGGTPSSELRGDEGWEQYRREERPTIDKEIEKTFIEIEDRTNNLDDFIALSKRAKGNSDERRVHDEDKNRIDKTGMNEERKKDDCRLTRQCKDIEIENGKWEIRHIMEIDGNIDQRVQRKLVEEINERGNVPGGLEELTVSKFKEGGVTGKDNEKGGVNVEKIFGFIEAGKIKEIKEGGVMGENDKKGGAYEFKLKMFANETETEEGGVNGKVKAIKEGGVLGDWYNEGGV
ncbi:hypothetical protein O9G_005886 [Rozella allomycis CSF55]|uniref:Uncharacterized protein n=1 Tax=Rozella allomycis (strain CSF55) TaxID=988480 RepID=A0A075B5D9_ROZAC|nr:hypothetical protein O9G_005886 [Rozella allomycis CSF55]|eukprot:EPZ37021.1 hypothetical protein O9G_005886 [Rozella allomycis CSF55]